MPNFYFSAFFWSLPLDLQVCVTVINGFSGNSLSLSYRNSTSSKRLLLSPTCDFYLDKRHFSLICNLNIRFVLPIFFRFNYSLYHINVTCLKPLKSLCSSSSVGPLSWFAHWFPQVETMQLLPAWYLCSHLVSTPAVFSTENTEVWRILGFILDGCELPSERRKWYQECPPAKNVSQKTTSSSWEETEWNLLLSRCLVWK